MKVPARSVPRLPLSEAEADDELENDQGHRRTKPATRRAHIRANFEESLSRRRPGETHSPRHVSGNYTRVHVQLYTHVHVHTCTCTYMYMYIHVSHHSYM